MQRTYTGLSLDVRHGVVGLLVLLLVPLAGALVAQRAPPPPRFQFPTIGQGIDLGEPQEGGKLFVAPGGRGAGGFADAYTLLRTALTTQDLAVNAHIFSKYFAAGHRATAMQAFAKIVEPATWAGNPKMARITAYAWDGNGSRGGIAAIMHGFEGKAPTLGLSELAWAYDLIAEVDVAYMCEVLEDEGLDSQARLFGTNIVHEYMHWRYLLKSVIRGQILDVRGGYRFAGARSISKSDAVHNADSYACFLTELWWAIQCGKETGWDVASHDSAQ